MNNSSLNSNPDILYMQNGEPYNPINLDIFLLTAKLICCSIGIPLNLLIAVTIIRLRRLRCKPRNIFLLGIIFSYLSYYVPPLIELISFALVPPESAESVCRVFMSVGGLPHALLLLTMLLALMDRYVAINFPLFHRDKMTVRFASGIISLTAISIVFLVKFVFIARIAPLGCQLWIIHSKILGLTIFVLFVLCTVLNLIVYRKTRTHLKESRTLAVRNDPIHDEIAMASSPLARSSGNEFFGVTSLVVTVCPIIVLLLTFLACRMIGKFDCNSLTWLAARYKELRSAMTTRLIHRG